MKTFLRRFLIFVVVVLALVYGVAALAPKNGKIEYGLTFSYPYAESLGLNWKLAYDAILQDLSPEYVRLSAYWNSVEPDNNRYRFDELDYQVNEAARHGVKVVLAVGRRLPRWPECHDPAWLKDLSSEVLHTEQLSYVDTVVRRYQDNSSVIAWQVENEPFLSTFGECPPLDTELFDKELALVKKIDLSRPIIVTDSGELSLWWSAGSRGDVFGTTLYRYVYSDVFERYWTNYIPAVFYRFKAGLLQIVRLGNKPIAIMELEAEPWTKAGIPNTPIEEQFKTMSFDNFNTIVGVARSTGFSPQYLWGAEWWYWMKEKGHYEFWDAAQALLNNP